VFGFFKKSKEVKIKSPIKGKIINLCEVEDEVFSSKIIGDGFAIKPVEGVVYSPVEGKVVQLFPTGHAIGIKTKEGLEILIHIGIDTVSMKGEGFTPYVKVDDKVNVGDKLISFDLELVRQKAKSDVVPVVITNMDVVSELKVDFKDSNVGDEVAYVKLK